MKPDDKLGKNFTFAEMTITTHREFLEENHNVPEDLLPAAKDLCKTLLDPIRDHFKQAVIVHSGYRCPALNEAIKGSKTSQHMVFEAADFHVNNHNLKEVWEWIWKESGLAWGQLILEGWASNQPSWIHISLGPGYRSAARCMQVMTWSKAKGYYTVAQPKLPKSGQ
jgi:zinc D-Ala-D-Ala carboxypeptidase